MIRTVVCEKEGCSGNVFYIETENNNLKLTCKNCRSQYDLDISYYEFTMLSNCSKCNNDYCHKCYLGNPNAQVLIINDNATNNKEIIEWYYATSDETEIPTRESVTWSKIAGEGGAGHSRVNKYLWNYEETILSNGESLYSSPILISILFTNTQTKFLNCFLIFSAGIFIFIDCVIKLKCFLILKIIFIILRIIFFLIIPILIFSVFTAS